MKKLFLILFLAPSLCAMEVEKVQTNEAAPDDIYVRVKALHDDILATPPMELAPKVQSFHALFKGAHAMKFETFKKLTCHPEIPQRCFLHMMDLFNVAESAPLEEFATMWNNCVQDRQEYVARGEAFAAAQRAQVQKKQHCCYIQ
jgi:hypothetical protein